VNGYKEDGPSEKGATEKASDDLNPKYRRSLMRIYKQFVQRMHALSHDSDHKEFMHALDWYMGFKGYTFEKALDITMRKKSRLFEGLLEDATDDDDTEDDDVTDETEDDDTNGDNNVELNDMDT